MPIATDWAFSGTTDPRLQGIAVGHDHLAVGIELETAIAGITDVAIGHEDLEESASLDGEVERILGLHESALRKELFGRHRAHTHAQRQAGGQLRLLRRLGAGLADGLIDQILEDRPPLLEAGGTDVGQVVRDHGHAGLLGVEPGLGDPERLVHGLLLPAMPGPTI